jgi:hypothetical protein
MYILKHHGNKHLKVLINGMLSNIKGIIIVELRNLAAYMSHYIMYDVDNNPWSRTFVTLNDYYSVHHGSGMRYLIYAGDQ